MSQAAVKKVRPKYLGLQALLFEIRLPLPGWVSIFHRVSGALLFFPAALWLLWMLDRSLSSPSGFDSVQRYAHLPLVKLALLVFIWSFCHHFCAGIRYLFLDLDKGLDKSTSRLTAGLALAGGLVLTAFFGAKLW
jgi:succinate dehydrogenase / fumarate reductase cytochrome b subunit